MFRTLASTSLRRSLHTSSRSGASARPARARAVLGASALAASYLVWNSWYGQRIALDAPASSSKSKQVPLTPKSSASPEAITHSDSTAPQHEPSIHPDPTSSPEVDASGDGQPADGPTESDAAEASSGQGGAFNPETGEINWDCPCLGGMAHGPCGLQFREAFSCFVFSEADPKGIDCVEKFKAMQECFREHPDVYGDDIMNDDEDEDAFAPDMDSPSRPDAPPEQPTQSEFAPAPAAADAPTPTPAPSPAEQKSKSRKPTATTTTSH